MILDTAPLDKSEAGIYWMHAESLCRTSSSLTQRMSLELPSRRYNLFSTYGISPLVGWDRGRISFDKLDAPLESSLQVGDQVEIQLVIPEHDSPEYATQGSGRGDETSGAVLPWYPKTKLYCQYAKWEKRVTGGVTVSMVGTPSEREHIFYFTHSWGHWRGSPTVWANAEGEKKLQNSIRYRGDTQIEPLDRGAVISSKEESSDWNKIWARYPAVTKSVKLTILSISTS